MGLLTGFSIISGVEIIFFLLRSDHHNHYWQFSMVASKTYFHLFLRLVGSFTISRAGVVASTKEKFLNHLTKTMEKI